MMIETRFLQQVLALAETRSFAKASKSIHLSQPALSRSIQKLEAQLGVLLFDRNRKQIQLTEAGILFVNRAKELLARAESLEREVNQLKGAQLGRVSIGAGPYTAELFLAFVLRTILTDHPDLSFRISIDHWVNLIQRLRDRELDIVLAEYAEVADDPDLDILPLTRHQAYFIVRNGHPLSGKKAVSHDEILRFSLAQITHMPARVTKQLVTKSPKSEFKNRVGAVTDNLFIQREIIKGSDMVGMFILTQVEEELNKRKFVVLPCRLEGLHGHWGVITRKGQKSSPVKSLFITLAVEVDRNIAEREKKLTRRFARF